MKEPINLIMCRDCDDEVTPDVSPDDFHDIQVRLVGDGICIWCRRHNKEIVTLELDPEDVRKYAHTSRVHGERVN